METSNHQIRCVRCVRENRTKPLERLVQMQKAISSTYEPPEPENGSTMDFLAISLAEIAVMIIGGDAVCYDHSGLK